LGNQLARVLLEESYQVSRKLYLSDLRRGPNCCAVFISGDAPEYRAMLSLLHEEYIGLPVIVVTRQPDVKHWLDVLESGATDYCGAPFERVQLRCILNSALAQASRSSPALPDAAAVSEAIH